MSAKDRTPAFLKQAIDASLARMEQLGVTDPTQAGVSVIVPANEDRQAMWRRVVSKYNLGEMVSSTLQGLGIVYVALIGVAFFPWMIAYIGLHITIGFSLGIGSLVIVALGPAHLRWLARRGMRTTIDEPMPPSSLLVRLKGKPSILYSEIPDDMGLAFMDSGSHALRIEGLNYRCLIHAQDVREVSLAKSWGHAYVKVTFRIDEQSEITLTLHHAGGRAAMWFDRWLASPDASQTELVALCEQAFGKRVTGA